jgi:hypothetical protein
METGTMRRDAVSSKPRRACLRFHMRFKRACGNAKVSWSTYAQFIVLQKTSGVFQFQTMLLRPMYLLHRACFTEKINTEKIDIAKKKTGGTSQAPSNTLPRTCGF